MLKMKYLMPDVDKHTAGIIYISMIGVLLTTLAIVKCIPGLPG